MNPSGRIIKNLKQLSGLMVVALASTLLVSAPGSAETWTTKGTCWFNGVPRGCRVQAASDLSAQAWSATYVIDWATEFDKRLMLAVIFAPVSWLMAREQLLSNNPPIVMATA